MTLGEKLVKIREPLAIVALAWLGLACAGCGGASSRPSSAPDTSVAARPGVARTGAVSHPRLGVGSLPQDEDDDDGPGEEVGLDPHDPDIDGDNDYLKPRGFYDRDDGALRGFGQRASAAEKRALTTLFTRYYAAAAGEDGASACSMMTTAFAKSVPESFGHGSAGPSYLRAARTCAAVMTLLFKHLHATLSEPAEVIRVGVDGDKGLALVGAKNMRASYMDMQREAGGWKIVGQLPSQLP